ncbi:MAG: response regulator transcription factor [Candidatus Peribacteria bacterium]|nr:MAG: response regulator transcription factor [Candidatus Peribacteria bacterium]
MMHTILLIEDDIGISESLKLYLENSDYKVFLHHDGGNALQIIREVAPDLVILDVNLPGKDGIEICKAYRQESETPVIMLTARSGEIDKVNGLEVGADDYIAKPFSPRELLARIKGILRRSSTPVVIEQEGVMVCEHITIDTNKVQVLVKGKPVSLTKNEYDILVRIMREDGKLVSREAIMKEVIGYEQYMYDRTIDTHIKNLRKKLDAKDMIITVRGE